jgi:hypothetical protein
MALSYSALRSSALATVLPSATLTAAAIAERVIRFMDELLEKR